ncbi:MAG: type II toxin-antitoxin system VapC family toxin [Acidimicrobiales bacterium]
MLAVDVNVLVYAHRADAERHDEYRGWLESARSGDEPLGLSHQVLAGFVRVVTHPNVFYEPTPLPDALAFVDALTASPAAVPLVPGPRCWPLFRRLCADTEARGNAVPDAYLAALALEHGAVWVTADRGFARFPELRTRHPLG